MKLNEIVNGTYVAVTPTFSTLGLIQAWAKHAGILLRNDLHVTVLYSRVPVRVSLDSAEHIAHPVGFDIFDDNLVLLLDAPSLQARHNQLIRQGGTHDYPDYNPHMTLQSATKVVPEQLQLPKHALSFWREYTEKLDV